MLTIVASNRDRLDFNSNQTNLFLNGLRNQTVKDFHVIISDGGSNNFEQIQAFCKNEKQINISVVQHKIGEKFQRALLNNVGIRHAKTEYVMTTDVDIFFAKDFVEYLTLLFKRNPDVFVESRTLYWKDGLANNIYNGKLNPWEDLNSCKIGRIKNRTTAGGCQCTSVKNWEKVHGFNEEMIGWGSEDYDLLTRIGIAKIKTIWIGETREEIRVFHQPHPKPNLIKDLEDQNKNKIILNSIKSYCANPNGWGGISTV